MSSTDSKLDQIIKELNKLKQEFNSYKEYTDNIVSVNTNLVQEIANQINTKIDILCNIENSTNVNSTKSSTKKNKSLSKTAFFKDKLKVNINEFINVLYTEAEIKNLYDNDDVKSKKTETTKKNKIIDLLYNHITKNDEEKHNKLKSLYEDYKKNIDNESVTSEE
jgi:hypothetical protein